MPFVEVEVWVDPEPCDGTCESADEAKELQARVDEAVFFLNNGDAVAALSALTDDHALGLKTPKSIAETYQKWKDGKLAGFTNFKMSN